MDIKHAQDQIEDSYKEGKLTEYERMRLLEKLMWEGVAELKKVSGELLQQANKMGI